jgi:hypothetical protein
MNLPPKTALAAVLLSTALCPRATHALDNQPLSAECHIAVIKINGQAECVLPAIPNGKRWVIETVTGSLELPAGIQPAIIDLHLTTGEVATDNLFPAKFQGTSDFYPGDFYTINEQVRLYQDGGLIPSFNLALTNNAPGATGFLTVSGYLVDAH